MFIYRGEFSGFHLPVYILYLAILRQNTDVLPEKITGNPPI